MKTYIAKKVETYRNKIEKTHNHIVSILDDEPDWNEPELYGIIRDLDNLLEDGIEVRGTNKHPSKKDLIRELTMEHDFIVGKLNALKDKRILYNTIRLGNEPSIHKNMLRLIRDGYALLVFLIEFDSNVFDYVYYRIMKMRQFV